MCVKGMCNTSHTNFERMNISSPGFTSTIIVPMKFPIYLKGNNNNYHD